jgi:hypothetical protein
MPLKHMHECILEACDRAVLSLTQGLDPDGTVSGVCNMMDLTPMLAVLIV